MSAKGPYRFRLLHVVDVLAAICIVAISVGLYALDLPWTSYRTNPLPFLVGLGLFVGYRWLRESVLAKL